MIMHVILRDKNGKLLAKVGYGRWGSAIHRVFCTEPGSGEFWTQYGDLWNVPEGGTMEITEG